MEMDAEREAGVLVPKLRQVAVVFGVDPVEADRGVFRDVIEETAEEGGEIFPFGRAPDSTVIVVVVLKLHAGHQEQRLGDFPCHGRRDLIEAVVVKVQELVIGIIAAILVVDLEQEPLGWMHADLVIQPVRGVMPPACAWIAAGDARLRLGELPILEDVRGLVIQAARNEVVLEAGFHFLLDKISLGIVRLPEPACGILRFNKEMGGQLNRSLAAQRLLEEVFIRELVVVHIPRVTGEAIDEPLAQTMDVAHTEVLLGKAAALAGRTKVRVAIIPFKDTVVKMQTVQDFF